MSFDPILVTTRVSTTLEKLGVRYFVAGSFAGTLYGMVRTTQDPDLVTELKMGHIALFLRELEEEFYIDE